MLQTEANNSMSRFNAELDERVGYYPRPVRWPVNMEDVLKASDEQLLEWYRFLPGFETPDQEAMMDKIAEILFGGKPCA